jgi:hypothetical protein
LLLAISSGFLPYFGGGVLVFLTHDMRVLAFAGVLITTAGTYGAYVIRNLRDPITAKQRLIIDPFLYGFEYVFTVVMIYCMFLR